MFALKGEPVYRVNYLTLYIIYPEKTLLSGHKKQRKTKLLSNCYTKLYQTGHFRGECNMMHYYRRVYIIYTGGRFLTMGGQVTDPG